MYKIEKNIPMIHPKFGRSDGSKYPFRDMVKGDSFLVPVDPDTYETWDKVMARVAAACGLYVNTHIYPETKPGYRYLFALRKDKICKGIRVYKLTTAGDKK